MFNRHDRMGADLHDSPRLKTVIAQMAMLVAALCLGSPCDAMTTCAMVSDGPSDGKATVLAAMLEVKLAEMPDIRMVERQAISLVLEEQKLSALSGASAHDGRVRLGKLLKAEVIIMIRPAEEHAGELDVTVFETAGGLRLLAQRMPVVKIADAGQDELDAVVRAMTAAIVDALKRISGPIRHVIAVPPFADKGLTTEHERMMDGYARIIEQYLLGREGVLVVELEEADAIAREYTLAGDRVAPIRPLPIYVIGEFRHYVAEGVSKADIGLAVRRGEQSLGSRKLDGIAADEASRAILQAVSSLVGEAMNLPLMPPDIAGEVAQLNERARQLNTIGADQQALRLYEASLLLNRHQIAIHGAALQTVIQQAAANFLLSANKDEQRQMTARVLRIWRKGVHHAEYLVRHVLEQELPDNAKRMMFEYPIIEYLQIVPDAMVPFEWKGRVWNLQDCEQMEDVNRSLRDALLEVVKQQPAVGDFHSPTGRLLGLVNHATPPLESRAATYEVRTGLIEYLVNSQTSLPDVWTHVSELLRMIEPVLPRGRMVMPSEWMPMRDAANKDYFAFLQAAADVSPPVIAGYILDRRLSVLDWNLQTMLPRNDRYLKEHLESVKRSKERLTRIEQGKDDVAPVRYGPLPLKRSDTGHAVFPCGWLTGDDKVEVVFTRQEIFLMREPGKLDLIFRVPADFEGLGFYHPCFDGKYAWLPCVGTKPLLVVVEPATGRHWAFGADAGVPPMNRGATAAPLAPGRACLIGGFGENAGTLRGWCANVDMKGDAGLQIDVFHESKKAFGSMLPADDNFDQIGFLPAAARMIYDHADPTIRRVVCMAFFQSTSEARATAHLAEVRHWLVVDPDRKNVKVSRVHSDHNIWVLADGQIKLPDRRGCRHGVSYVGGEVYAYGEGELYYAPDGIIASIRLGGSIPPYSTAKQQPIVLHSAHHGLVLLNPAETDHLAFDRWKPYTITVDPKAKHGDVSRGFPVAVDAKPQPKVDTSHTRADGIFVNSIDMKFVSVPAGTFMMGSPPDEPGRGPDETLHKVTIPRPFKIGMTEVTRGQWVSLMGQLPAHDPDEVEKDDPWPVRRINYADAAQFCAELSKREGRFYRLPTEAEWEYACRAGSTTAYSSGDDHRTLDAVARYRTSEANARNMGPMPVASFAPNAWGIYDMHGNLWEWVATRASEWSGQPVVDAFIAMSSKTGAPFVMRGGSWSNDPPQLRSAERRLLFAEYGSANYTFGLRVVLDERPADEMPPDKTFFDVTFKDHRYIAFTGRYAWEHASRLARAIGGQLMVVQDQEEWDFISKHLLEGRGAYWWLGLKSDGARHVDVNGVEQAFFYGAPNRKPWGDLRPVCTRGQTWALPPAPPDLDSKMGFVVEFGPSVPVTP